MVTVDDALNFLREARKQVGGDACLILSLTGSEIEDTGVTAMHAVKDGESRYIEVRVTHPSLKVL